MMNIILMGAPGAGKGTQAKLISERFGLPHISTGEIFRKIMSDGATLSEHISEYMNKGLLVPDEIVIEIVKERLGEPDCENGFILDGFPRTVCQADELKDIVKIDYCINIRTERRILIERLAGRRTCLGCGRVYHISNYPHNRCECGGLLHTRADDSEETVNERLRVYEESTEPLIGYYKKEGLLVNINGADAPEDVFDAICVSVGKR